MKQLKELKISSLQSNISRVERFIEEICDDNYISYTYFGNIMLAIEEAVKNAIIHGNKQVENKWVTLTFERRKGELQFIIEDEGGGFDPKEIPNPLDSDDSKGNGIFLMRSLADTVRYNPAGNKVELTFTISSINQEISLNRISQLKSYFNRQKSLVKL
jgi:serine/threonine-protein kinase RsbW